MAVVHGLDGKEAEEEEAQWRIQGRERGEESGVVGKDGEN